MIQIPLSGITDKLIRDAFRTVQDFINGKTILDGTWKLIEITNTSAVTSQAYSHGLSFTPTDAIPLSVSSGTVTWHTSLFDSNSVYYTTSAASTVRALVGRTS